MAPHVLPCPMIYDPGRRAFHQISSQFHLETRFAPMPFQLRLQIYSYKYDGVPYRSLTGLLFRHEKSPGRFDRRSEPSGRKLRQPNRNVGTSRRRE